MGKGVYNDCNGLVELTVCVGRTVDVIVVMVYRS